MKTVQDLTRPAARPGECSMDCWYCRWPADQNWTCLLLSSSVPFLPPAALTPVIAHCSATPLCHTDLPHCSATLSYAHVIVVCCNVVSRVVSHELDVYLYQYHTSKVKEVQDYEADGPQRRGESALAQEASKGSTYFCASNILTLENA